MPVTSKLKQVKIDATGPIQLTGQNPRGHGVFDEKDVDFKKLVTSMTDDGFREDKALVLSERADGTTWLLQGHRRLAAARLVRKRYPDRLETVPCVVFKGLTLADECRMMIDHFLVKDLDRAETYEAIKRLRQSGMSEPEIMRTTGLNRFRVQRAGWVMSAPQVVEDAILAKLSGKEEYVPITDVDLQAISAANVADREEAKTTGIDLPPEGGERFREVWERLMATGKAKPSEPKAKTRKELTSLAGSYKESILVSVLKYAAGDPVDLGSVLSEITVLRAKARAYDELDASTAEKAAV